MKFQKYLILSRFGLNSTRLYDLIEWKTQHPDANPNMNSKFITYYTEPPLLSDFSENNLHLVVTEGKVPDEVYVLPCHNQNIEIVIKLVNEYS